MIFFINALKSRKGSSTIVFAIALVVVTAVAALVIDVGVIVLEKAQLSSTVDSAALAGAQELVANSDNTQNVINSYILKNSDPLKQVDISIDANNKVLTVKGIKNVQNYFAKIFGNDTQDISATAKAKVENIKSLKGVRPLAVVQQVFTYGKLYTLKEGAGGGSSGNYAAIALGGTGSSLYRNNILYGYNGTVSVGDVIETETGNMSGTTETSISQLINQCDHSPSCTYDYYNKNCPRIIFIPIVDTLDVNGRKFVKVLGFGTFFLEGVTNHGGQADVKGRFITYHAQGETSNDIGDFGTYGIRLIK